jgi:2-oxoglutarate ferredoxin oxidoreductase subunit alpha
MDFNFLIGGEAGQGIQSIGYILTLTMAKGGHHVFSAQDYESRIRGGHNFFTVRIGDSSIKGISEEINLIIALNKETITRHRSELSRNGLIIYDGERYDLEFETPHLLSVPFERLAQDLAGTRIMSNTVALGAALCVIGYDLNILASILTKIFGKRSQEIAEKNVKAAKAGYDYVQALSGVVFDTRLSTIGKSERMVINGAEAIGLGALVGGCQFMAGYPMTPATGILQYFASKSKEHKVVFEHAEDEVSAINMIVGASFAGVRTMTATSGGGFSLMVEGLSLAGMTETPIVIVISQRPGPATGLPTRTEQGELEFAIHGGHGDFPRVVFAPGTAEEAFHLTIKALNIAEKYQVPAIILTDKSQVDSYVTTERFDISKEWIKTRNQSSNPNQEKPEEPFVPYQRYRITESGVSPREFPGNPHSLVIADSDEHNEEGHITESPFLRNEMVKKRQRKLEGIRRELKIPFSFGSNDASTVIVCWGSTYGAVLESVNLLNQNNQSVKMIHLSEVWPFPRKEFENLVKDSERLVVVEGNATGQMAHLIAAETGLKATKKILRFDGRPFTSNYIMEHYLQED